MKRLLPMLVVCGLMAVRVFGAQAEIVQNERRALSPRVGSETPVTPGESWTPFMFALAAPLQAPPDTWDVGGLRLSALYGECQNFAGLDINGLVGRARGHGNGLQVALLANIVDGDGLGLQIAPVNYVSGSYDGWQIGAVNYGAAKPQSTAQALQIGFFNGSDFIKGCRSA